MPEEEKIDSRKDMSKKMIESTKEWNVIVKNLSARLKGDIATIVDVKAEAISHRQSVIEEVKVYTVKIYKLVLGMVYTFEQNESRFKGNYNDFKGIIRQI